MSGDALQEMRCRRIGASCAGVLTWSNLEAASLHRRDDGVFRHRVPYEAVCDSPSVYVATPESDLILETADEVYLSTENSRCPAS